MTTSPTPQPLLPGDIELITGVLRGIPALILTTRYARRLKHKEPDKWLHLALTPKGIVGELLR